MQCHFNFFFFFILAWMDTDVLYEWFEKFINKNQNRPLLLLFDRHLMDISLSAIKRAIKRTNYHHKICTIRYQCSPTSRCCVFWSFEMSLRIATPRACEQLWRQIQFNKTWFCQLVLQNMEKGVEFNNFNQRICF